MKRKQATFQTPLRKDSFGASSLNSTESAHLVHYGSMAEAPGGRCDSNDIINKQINTSRNRMDTASSFQSRSVTDITNTQRVEQHGTQIPTHLHHNVNFDTTSNPNIHWNDIDDQVPNTGICLMFQSINDYYGLSIEEDKLVAHRNDGLTDEEYSQAQSKHFISRKTNLVKYFKESNIHYTMIASNDKEQTFIYVIIGIDFKTAHKWAEKLSIDLEISPVDAVKVGRKQNFRLASRYK